jgi:hypothetical protein
MAQFRATAGNTSRLGHKPNGISTTLNGWYGGVFVVATHENDKDRFQIFTTLGSNNQGGEFIGEVDHEGNFTPASK